jgi:hypothetical protein
MFTALQLKADHARLRRFLLGGNKGDSPEYRHSLGRVLVWALPPIEHLGDSHGEKQSRLDWFAIVYCSKARELIRRAPILRGRKGKNPRRGTVATAAYLEISPTSGPRRVRPYASYLATEALTAERLERLGLWNPIPEWEAYLDTGKTNRNWLDL